MPACPKCGSPLVTPLNWRVCKTTFTRPLSFAESVPAPSPDLTKELQLYRRVVPRAPEPADRSSSVPKAPVPTAAENSWLAPPSDSMKPLPLPKGSTPQLGSTRPLPFGQAPARFGSAPARARQAPTATAVRSTAALPPRLPRRPPVPTAAKPGMPAAMTPLAGDGAVESGALPARAPPHADLARAVRRAGGHSGAGPHRRAHSATDALPPRADPAVVYRAFAKEMAARARTAAAASWGAQRHANRPCRARLREGLGRACQGASARSAARHSSQIEPGKHRDSTRVPGPRRRERQQDQEHRGSSRRLKG